MRYDRIKKGAALAPKNALTRSLLRKNAGLILLAIITTATTHAQVYEVETLKNNETYPRPPLKKAPEVNYKKVFALASRCGPTPSIWDAANVKLAGSYRELESTTTDDYGRYYIGIIADMPLFTGAEVARQRNEEEGRRRKIAEDVRYFKDSVADYRLAQRLLGLYASLERRSQQRIKAGVAPTAEQVSYLEKTAKAYRDMLSNSASMQEAELALLARCTDKNKNREKLQLLLTSYMRPK